MALLLFVLCAAVYVPTATLHGSTSVDVAAADATSWELGNHGDLTLDRVPVRVPGMIVRADGRWVSNRFPGTVFLAAPAYRLLGSPTVTLGPGAVVGALTAAGAVVLLFLVLSGLTSQAMALLGSLLLGFGTATWSVSADGLWTHGPAQLTVAAAMLALTHERWALAGLALGAAELVRPHLSVIALVVVAWLVLSRRPTHALRVLPGVALGAAAYLLYARLLYGHWTVRGEYGIGYPGLGPVPFGTNLAGALLSPHRGLLPNTPWLLPLLPFLPAAWRAAPGWARACAVAAGAYTAVQLALGGFVGGYGFFSYRLLLSPLTLLLPLLALATAELARRGAAWSWVFGTTVALSVFVHAAGARYFVPTQADRGHWLPWAVVPVLDVMPLTAIVLLGAVTAAAGAVVARAVSHRRLPT